MNILHCDWPCLAHSSVHFPHFNSGHGSRVCLGRTSSLITYVTLSSQVARMCVTTRPFQSHYPSMGVTNHFCIHTFTCIRRPCCPLHPHGGKAKGA